MVDDHESSQTSAPPDCPRSSADISDGLWSGLVEVCAGGLRSAPAPAVHANPLHSYSPRARRNLASMGNFRPVHRSPPAKNGSPGGHAVIHRRLADVGYGSEGLALTGGTGGFHAHFGSNDS